MAGKEQRGDAQSEHVGGCQPRPLIPACVPDEQKAPNGNEPQKQAVDCGKRQDARAMSQFGVQQKDEARQERSMLRMRYEEQGPGARVLFHSGKQYHGAPLIQMWKRMKGNDLKIENMSQLEGNFSD